MNYLDRINALLNCGGMKRFHTEANIPSQTIRAHSWNMAVMAMTLWPEDDVLLRAVLTHDVGEDKTGDLPASAKWEYPELAKITNQIEKERRIELEVEFQLSYAEQIRLKFLDKMECALYCHNLYVNHGNLMAGTIMNRLKSNLTLFCEYTYDDILGGSAKELLRMILENNYDECE